MASIERLHRTAPLDLARLEEDVVGSLPAIRVAPSGPMPDYVEHEEGVPRVGALTAEAVVRDYEAAAREIEAMGAELINAAKKYEAAVSRMKAMALCATPQPRIVRKPKRSSSASKNARSLPSTFARPARPSNSR